MVEGKDLVLCPFVSQLYSSKYQDMKFILSKHLFRFEEVLGKRSEGESYDLELVSDTCGNQGPHRDSNEHKIHKTSFAAKRDTRAEDFLTPG